MSERKVLNKYYPKDYDPGNIPRAKRPKNRQWTIRTMAPFNMRCNTCGGYVYKGKKFNSRQEVAEGETYLGLKIFRFYIKCPTCVSEITFKTDPQSVDYVLEAGATRNFEALRMAELMAQKEAAEKEAELENNPMKMLENRTASSQREMDMIETLEDLRELNSKNAKLDMNELIEEKVKQQKLYEVKLKELQEDEDEAFVQSVFGKNSSAVVKRLSDSEGSDGEKPSPTKMPRLQNPTDFLTEETPSESEPVAGTSTQSSSTVTASTSSSGITKNVPKNVPALVKPKKKSSLGMLVKRKDPSKSTGVAKQASASKPSLYEMIKQKEANSKKSSTNVSTSSNSNLKNDSDSKCNSVNTDKSTKTESKPFGLGLVAGYSDSDESSEND